MSENLIYIPGQKAPDKQFEEYKEFFTASKIRDGITSYQPKQWVIPPERFGGQFHILYQLCREDESGEEYSFRVFYRNIQGRRIKTWIDHFHRFFVDKHLVDIGKKEKLNIRFCESGQVRHQMDFMIFSMPGRYAELIVDEYFRELREHL